MSVDVRKALTEIIMSIHMTSSGREVYVSRLVTAITSDPYIEVRLRGTVTDAEVQRLREVIYRQTGCSLYQTPEQARAALEAALQVKPHPGGEALTFEQYIEGTE